MMAPERPLPFVGNFGSVEDYVEKLLEFSRCSETFQILCGGVHILDFFTSEPGQFHVLLPEDWQGFLLSLEIEHLLELLLRADLDSLSWNDHIPPPKSFLEYIRAIRSHSLDRTFSPRKQKQSMLPRSVAVGMKPKKIHEVLNFADYVDRLSKDVAGKQAHEITHLVDFGSGQNYLGRALASEPYNKRVVAVEGREINVKAAKRFDKLSGLAATPKVMRNKKLWNKVLEEQGPEALNDMEALRKAAEQVDAEGTYDFGPSRHMEGVYAVEEGKGHVQYVSGQLDSGDLSDIVTKIRIDQEESEKLQRSRLMAVSIHSCGNLSHYGIRSMIMNPSIKAVAIVGCCYNLMTEKLGPPSFKPAFFRPTLRALNARVVRESEMRDPQGFPMSQLFSTYKDEGVRLNITARMMACQAIENWTQEDSESFFQRHFFRAVLQKIFLDRGVVTKTRHDQQPGEEALEDHQPESPFNMSTNPVIIGSLRKKCYASLKSYVRGVIEKLTTSNDYKQYAEVVQNKMGDITDEEIERYEAIYQPRKKELSIVWTLMAFSAAVVEALIVTDRWMFLKEHTDIVEDAWVETVFDYKESPRNLVVVGIKKEDVGEGSAPPGD